jgi:tetratricopeptide (TPR) repeat protein
MKSLRLLFPFAISLIAFACTKPTDEADLDQPVAVSLDGKLFYEPSRTPEQQQRLDSLLKIARDNFEADPSEENYIWYGRREGYLMHLHEAVAIFTEGLEKYPDSYRLYRHRGHRYISMRKFEHAIADLEKAALLMEGKPLEIEPDGKPNRLNKPLSTTQFNVWYHLGLAHYLKGQFNEAETAYLNCLEVSENDDSRVAVYDWLYMIYRRKGEIAEAEVILGNVNEGMEIIENDSYYLRLRMYKGLMKPEQLLVADSTKEDYDLSMATQGYGVGNWYLYNGDTLRATETFTNVTAGKLFAAFGFIAAEAELARGIK